MTGEQVLVAVGAVVLLLVVAVVASYNRFVRQRNLVQESWRQVDVELTRRHDLIPNLVATVQGYAAHERAVHELAAQARQLGAAGGGVAAQARQEEQLGSAVRQVVAVAEAYPDLKADAQFAALQAQLAETEDRIAAGRRFYNGNVRALNTRVSAFPSSVIASVCGFGPAEYFEAQAAERAPVRVDPA